MFQGMSTVMYAWRFPDGRFEEVLGGVRLRYETDHPIVAEIGTMALACRRESDRGWAWARVRELIAAGEHGQPDWLPELQLFREAGGTWLLRPLEVGHFFAQLAQDMEEDLEPVVYDDRTDVPAADAPNEAVARWVDARIRTGGYLLHPLLDRMRLELWAGALSRGEDVGLHEFARRGGA